MTPESSIIIALARLISVLILGYKSLVNTIRDQTINLQGSSKSNLALIAEVSVLTRETATLKFNGLVSDKKIEQLTNQVKTLSENVEEKDTVIAGLQSVIAALQAENTALTQRVIALEATIQARDTELRAIKKPGAGPLPGSALSSEPGEGDPVIQQPIETGKEESNG